MSEETIQQDQEARFLKAFEDYSDALFRHAFVRISDRERAIDLVHDTFAKVWGYLRSGHHEIVSFRPFLYKVLNNLIIDEYRKAKESSLDALMEVEGIDEGNFSELHHNPVESIIANLDGEKALAMISKMPDQYREVLILKFVDELGPKEIAELVEESENVVSVRLHRGLKLLKKLVADLEEEKAQNLQ